MMYVTITYLLYTLLSLGLTIWVGRTLFKNGRMFVIDAFNGNETMGDAVNHLLLVGFYLLNFGFVSLYLSYGEKPANLVESIEFISVKIGIVLVVLGAMHFFNVYNFAKMRSKAARKRPLETSPTINE